MNEEKKNVAGLEPDWENATGECELCEIPFFNDETRYRYWYWLDGIQAEKSVICPRCRYIIAKHYDLQTLYDENSRSQAASPEGTQVRASEENGQATGDVAGVAD